ncbi:MAG: hypothetical protein QXY99_06320 [Thermoproteota archaeon]
MRFTEGFWRMRPGVTPHYPVQVQEVKAEPDSLTVYAATRRVAHRADTISLPLLTIRFTSPMENIYPCTGFPP